MTFQNDREMHYQIKTPCVQQNYSSKRKETLKLTGGYLAETEQ